MRKSRALYIAANTTTTASSRPSTPYTTGPLLAPRSPPGAGHRMPPVPPWSATTPKILGDLHACQQQGGEGVGHELVPAGVGVDPVRPEQLRVGRPGHRPRVQADHAPFRRLLPDDVAGLPHPLPCHLDQV